MGALASVSRTGPYGSSPRASPCGHWRPSPPVRAAKLPRASKEALGNDAALLLRDQLLQLVLAELHVRAVGGCFLLDVRDHVGMFLRHVEALRRVVPQVVQDRRV